MATTIDRSQALQQLLQEEIGLRDHAERVAVMRRELTPGPVVKDYVFREGPADLAQRPKGFSRNETVRTFQCGQARLARLSPDVWPRLGGRMPDVHDVV